MSEFHTTIFVLEKIQKKEEFVKKCHEILIELDCQLEKEDSFITFNDGFNGEDKDVLYLDDSLTDDDILESLTDWNFLGNLDYVHKKLNIIISVNYVTFDKTTVQVIDFGIVKLLMRNEMFEKSYREFLVNFASKLEVSRFCYDTGHLDYGEHISDVLKMIDNMTLEFDFITNNFGTK